MSDLPNLVKLLKSLFDRGDSVSDVTGKLKIDLTLAWTLTLGDMDDISRMEKLSENNNGQLGHLFRRLTSRVSSIC